METTKKNTLQNVFAVLVGALLMGFLWRVRGETGWGSSWGLLNAGFVFTMFLCLAKENRKKLDIGWLSLTALSFMLTVPSWGTLLSQITGVLHEPELWKEGDAFVYVSIPSAIILMLSLGFGLATIYGIMLGRGFSDKQWKVKDFIIVLAVFFISGTIAKATVSHWFLELIQPQAVEIFEKGLAAANVDGDVYTLYLQHFDDLSWGKKFDGGRNYFSSIQAISSVVRSVCSILAVRFIVKDKISTKVGTVVSVAFAFAITVADLFFYFGNGGYHMENPSPFSSFIYPWGCWEYFTGFISGAIITAYILKLRNTENVNELAFNKVPEKANTVLTFILGFVFMIGVSIVRPVLERFDDSDYQIIATVIAVLVAIAVVVLMNIKWGINAKNVSTAKLFSVLLPAFVAYIFITYMFIGTAEKINISLINSLQTVMCIISVAVTLIWSAISIKRLNK